MVSFGESIGVAATAIKANWKMAVVPLGGHFIFGIYPIVSRYLQSPPISLPTLPVLGVASALNLVIVFAYLIIFVPQFWKVFLNKKLWLFSLVTGLRAVTNIYAALWTNALYVTLFTLVTPYVVALLERVFLKEPLPRAFFVSLLGTGIGSVLILLGPLIEKGAPSLTWMDALGMGTAFLSAVFLACYMVMVRVALKEKFHVLQTYGMQIIAMTFLPLLLSIAVPSDWHQFALLDAKNWVIFFVVLALGIYFGGNMCTMYSVSLFGAAYNSVFLGVRLLVAGIGGMLILDEAVTAWQWVGSGVVIASLSYFLYRQMSGARPTAVTSASGTEELGVVAAENADMERAADTFDGDHDESVRKKQGWTARALGLMRQKGSRVYVELEQMDDKGALLAADDEAHETALVIGTEDEDDDEVEEARL